MNGESGSWLDIEVIGTALRDFLAPEAVMGFFGDIVAAAAILVAGFILAGWASRRVRGIGGRNKHMDPTLFTFLGNIARYTVMAFAVLFVLNTFGVQTTSIVAVFGAAGLAIGLALQGTLSNVAAGVMIVFFRPIKQGDFVSVGGEMGVVKEITLNFTELATPDNEQVVIPNAQIRGNTITNYSVYDLRRAEWVFGVS